MSYWTDQCVLVTGGASFIGSHLVDSLLHAGVQELRIVDDLSSGSLDNINHILGRSNVTFVEGDVLANDVRNAALCNVNTVFHLAAVHGGRGFVDLQQADTSVNFAIDSLMIKAAYEAGAMQFVYASSGCVYPNYRQMKPAEELFLTESDVGPPFDSDNIYGWAKLAGEMSLRAYYAEKGFRSVSCRLFTVYGERAKENHAIIGLIARALTRQDPFEIWGTGTQVRNWTHVTDIVRGLMLAGEKIFDATAVNLGTEERITVAQAAEAILRDTRHNPQIRFVPHMPTGPLNRVASNRLAESKLGWTPTVGFEDGLRDTIAWYRQTKDLDSISHQLASRLLTR